MTERMSPFNPRLRRRRPMRAFAAAVVVSQTLLGWPAFAKGTGEADSARTERAAGTIAANLGRFEEAVEHFSQAYAFSQDPLLLFNLAQAYRLWGKADKALVEYSAFLRAAGGSAKYRAQMERAAAEIESITSFMLNHPVDSRQGGKVVAEDAPAVEKIKKSDTEPPPVAQEAVATAESDEREPKGAVAPIAPVVPSLAPKPEAVVAPAGDLGRLRLTETQASKPEPSQEPARPLYKRWWVWTAAAAVVVAAGGGVAWWYTRNTSEAPASTYGSMRVLP